MRGATKRREAFYDDARRLLAECLFPEADVPIHIKRRSGYALAALNLTGGRAAVLLQAGAGAGLGPWLDLFELCRRLGDDSRAVVIARRDARPREALLRAAPWPVSVYRLGDMNAGAGWAHLSDYAPALSYKSRPGSGQGRRGSEVQLERALYEDPRPLENALGLRLEPLRRQYPTESGPVDLAFRVAGSGGLLLCELKTADDRRAVGQLLRYCAAELEFAPRRPLTGVLVHPRPPALPKAWPTALHSLRLRDFTGGAPVLEPLAALPAPTVSEANLRAALWARAGYGGRRLLASACATLKAAGLRRFSPSARCLAYLMDLGDKHPPLVHLLPAQDAIELELPLYIYRRYGLRSKRIDYLLDKNPRRRMLTITCGTQSALAALLTDLLSLFPPAARGAARISA